MVEIITVYFLTGLLVALFRAIEGYNTVVKDILLWIRHIKVKK